MSDNPLKDAAAAGLYHLPPSRRATVETLAGRARFSLLKVDLAEQTSIESVLSQLGSAFKFPIWYGANFDALYDCLCDPDWQPAKGHVLLINGMARLSSAATRVLGSQKKATMPRGPSEVGIVGGALAPINSRGQSRG